MPPNVDTLPITVLVQTKNEAVGIAACLSRLSDFDEVIVVDSDSDDGTPDIVRAHGASVVNFRWNGEYPKKKQWQLENVSVRNHWILFLDADETPTVELIEELRARFSDGSPDAVAFDIDLDYVFAGTKLRYGHRVRKRCLVRPGRVEFPVMDDLEIPGMGELEGHYQPSARGRVDRLNSRILHNDLDPLASWFSRHNRYSDWEARLRFNRKARGDVRRNRSFQGRLFDRMPLKPLAFFIYSYVLRRGFQDGRAGFDYAFALAGYYWQIELKVRELARLESGRQ